MRKKLACLLCMQDKLNHIRLCSKRAEELDCAAIIAKHFWLKPNGNSKKCICLICWRSVREFHQFYELVAEAHNYIECKAVQCKTDLAQVTESDPLPDISKCDERTNEDAQEKVKNLEADKFEQKTESEFVDKIIKPSIRATRVTRRSQLKLENTNEKSSIKNSLEKKTCDDIKDCEPEIELPLSPRLLDQSSKTETFEECFKEILMPINAVKDEITAIEFSPPANDRNFDECYMQVIDSIPIHKSASISPLNEDHVEFSESDGLSDIEPPERYAELNSKCPTKNVTENRERPRPNAPNRRMTIEEIDAKNVQQLKYDEIIATLFDNFPCPRCNLLVCTFDQMRNHFKAAHNGKQPIIKCCGYQFHTRKNLADHVLLHENPEHFKCIQCEKCFKNSYTLQNHEKSHNPIENEERPIFECHICSKRLTTKTTLKEHLALKHTPASEFAFACTECDKRFPTKSTLKKHTLASHRKISRRFMCDQCGKSLQSSSALKYHIQNEHSNKPTHVECQFCDAKLTNEYSLKQHILCFHEKQDSEHRCEICGYLSSNERALKRHIYYNHKMEKKFACTMCEKAFKKKENLKEHISTHTGEGRHTCPECLMTFACKANYFKHKQRRHGHKPVQRNLIGLAEKKRQKLNATANKVEVAQLLCDAAININEQSISS